MRFYVRTPGTSSFSGPSELSEIQRQAASGALPADAEAIEATGQTHGQLKRASGWIPVSTLIHDPAPLPKTLTATTHCFVLSGSERRGPFVLSQVRTMWQSGAITADARLEWEGADPVPVATVLSRSAQSSIGGSSSDSLSGIIPGMTIFGGIVGLLVSYLMRPTVLGQGPTFGEWFTEGFDSPFASTIYICAWIGLLIGCIVGYLIRANAQNK